jgi:hypothetical protein
VDRGHESGLVAAGVHGIGRRDEDDRAHRGEPLPGFGEDRQLLVACRDDEPDSIVLADAQQRIDEAGVVGSRDEPRGIGRIERRRQRTDVCGDDLTRPATRQRRAERTDEQDLARGARDEDVRPVGRGGVHRSVVTPSCARR